MSTAFLFLKYPRIYVYFSMYELHLILSTYIYIQKLLNRFTNSMLTSIKKQLKIRKREGFHSFSYLKFYLKKLHINLYYKCKKCIWKKYIHQYLNEKAIGIRIKSSFIYVNSPKASVQNYYQCLWWESYRNINNEIYRYTPVA